MKNSDFVSSEIAVLLSKNCIREVSELPYFISPLSVAVQNSGKRRLILDLPLLNTYVACFKFRLEDIKTALPFLSKNGYIVTFDLRSGFHHIDIHPASEKYLGFSWIFNGVRRYFVFTVLCFGLSTAPFVFTKVLRNLIAYWRSMGIKIVIYIDDGIILEKSHALALSNGACVRRDLQYAGWFDASEKYYWIPRQLADWLGITIDLLRYVLSIPSHRVKACLEAISVILNSPTQQTARSVAKVTGKLISMAQVVGPIAQLQTRALYQCILNRASWDSFVSLNTEQLAELRF